MGRIGEQLRVRIYTRSSYLAIRSWFTRSAACIETHGALSNTLPQWAARNMRIGSVTDVS